MDKSALTRGIKSVTSNTKWVEGVFVNHRAVFQELSSRFCSRWSHKCPEGVNRIEDSLQPSQSPFSLVTKPKGGV